MFTSLLCRTIGEQMVGFWRLMDLDASVLINGSIPQWTPNFMNYFVDQVWYVFQGPAVVLYPPLPPSQGVHILLQTRLEGWSGVWNWQDLSPAGNQWRVGGLLWGSSMKQLPKMIITCTHTFTWGEPRVYIDFGEWGVFSLNGNHWLEF